MTNYNLKRKDDETFEEYHIRLFEDMKVHELDSVAIANLLNDEYGSNYDESKWRKDYAQYRKWKNYITEKHIDNENGQYLEEIKQAERDLYKLKVKVSDERREIRKYMTHEARLENLLEKLLDSIEEDIHTNKPLKWVKPLPSSTSKGSLLLMLSDLHKGMVTDNHWNKYNDEIFYQRLNQLTAETLEYKELLDVKEIHVFELGDIISGVIHRMTKLSETENAVESTQKVAEALSELVSVLANKFEKVHYYNVKGNHDRAAARKEEEVRTESFHTFVMWYMEMRLKDFGNVVFHKNEIDSEIITANIEGNTYYGVHGHLDKVTSVVQNLSLMLGKPKAILAGHIHKNFENEIHGVDIIVNGSFGGVDDYAKDGRMTGKAHQKLLWLNEKGRKGTFYITFNKN